MSMMRCSGCDGIVDTDDGLGLFEAEKPWRFWCERCLEDAVKNENQALLAALKVQEPEQYKELMQ